MTDKKVDEIVQEFTQETEVKEVQVEQKPKKTTRTKNQSVDIKKAALECIGYKDVNEECAVWQSEYEEFIEAVAQEEPVKLTEQELQDKYPTLKFLKAMTDTTNQEWRCDRYVDLVKEQLTDKQIKDYYQFIVISNKLRDAWEQAAKELDEHLMHKYKLGSEDTASVVLDEDRPYTGKLDA